MKSLIMSAQMVRALLDGRKTVTRRVIVTSRVARPPYMPNETVYVRETWQAYRNTPEHNFKGEHLVVDRWLAPRAGDRIVYAADQDDPREHKPWRSSIHMPEWASRIRLRITSVTAERLQDITDDEMRAEGFGDDHEDYLEEARILALPPGTKIMSLREYFAVRWSNLHKDPERHWESNPWVWRIEFERIEDTL